MSSQSCSTSSTHSKFRHPSLPPRRSYVPSALHSRTHHYSRVGDHLQNHRGARAPSEAHVNVHTVRPLSKQNCRILPLCDVLLGVRSVARARLTRGGHSGIVLVRVRFSTVIGCWMLHIAAGYDHYDRTAASSACATGYKMVDVEAGKCILSTRSFFFRHTQRQDYLLRRPTCSSSPQLFLCYPW